MDPYFSQCGEVKWIVDHLPIPPVGVFVDIGAHDGVTDSNTCHFERSLGWDGLVIDADPRNWGLLVNNRKCQKFLGAVGKPGRAFTLAENSQHSGFGRKGRDMAVPILPIENVLTAYGIGTIDLLSIDTEGTELEVWGGLDLDLHRPQIVIVEFYTTGQNGSPDRNMLEPTRERMVRDGYNVVHQACGNLILRRR